MPFFEDVTTLDLLGSMAGILTTIAFLPQVVRTWRTGSARDLSIWWLMTFATGVSLWLAYGLILGALPLTIANLITLALLAILLGLKLKAGR